MAYVSIDGEKYEKDVTFRINSWRFFQMGADCEGDQSTG